MPVYKSIISKVKNRSTPSTELLRIYNENIDEPDVAKYAASNPNSPPEIYLNILRRSEDGSSTPPGFTKVLRHLLKRKNLPTYIAERLSHNTNTHVRARAASVLSGGYSDRLTELYADPKDMVRNAVVRNIHTPPSTLIHATRLDPKPHIRRAADHTLSILYSKSDS